MRTWTIGSIIAASAAVSFLAGRVASQPATAPSIVPPPAEAKAKPDDQADGALDDIRKMLEEQSATVAEHELLEGLVGEYKTEARIYMDPSGGPLKSHGQSKAAWILGKRFVKIESSVGQAAEGKELASESLTIYGFDTRSRRYTVVAFDTLGTYWVSGEGTYDAASKELRLAGTVTEEGQTMKFRWMVKLEDTRNVTTVSIGLGGEDWMKVSELVQTREAAPEKK